MSRVQMSRVQNIRENFTRAVAAHQRRAIQEGLAELCEGVTFTCDFSRQDSVDSSVDDFPVVVTEVVKADVFKPSSPTSSPLPSTPVAKLSPTSVARDIDIVDSDIMPPTPSIFLRINNFEKLKIVCQVQFKYSYRYCMVTVPSKLIRNLKLGDFVITEGEKNQEDLGVITNAYSVDDFHVMRSYVGQSQDAEENMVGNILRLATMADRVKLPKKLAREESILGLCRELARDRYRLSMNIYGVEYQFDGSKLSVYYTSDARVDYREFAQDLFSRFRTKIWMRKTNQCSVFIPKPFATYALETGNNAFK